MNTKTLKGIGLFQLQILHLISIGKKESIKTIEEHMEKGDLIEYLFNKYKKHFSIIFDNTIYDNESLNQYFQNCIGKIQGNESRKYGIMNEDDGLLLIPASISDTIEISASTWTN